MSDQNENKSVADLSRRDFLGVSSTALATAAALVGITAPAQEVQDTRKAEKDISASDPGQEDKPLLIEPKFKHASSNRSWRYWSGLVLLRFGAQTGKRGWLDARGELEGAADLKGSGWRKHAAYCR